MSILLDLVEIGIGGLLGFMLTLAWLDKQISREKDAAFTAGYLTATAYAQEPQPDCGHAVANRATFMLQPSGELVEYCSACPPKNGNTDRQLETVAAGALCQSDNELWGV